MTERERPETGPGKNPVARPDEGPEHAAPAGENAAPEERVEDTNEMADEKATVEEPD